MPEIAEVRLIADNISNFLKGHQITNIDLLHPDIIAKYSKKHIKGLPEFNKAMEITPTKVISVQTKGKFCWIEMENNWNIMIGFGMSGNVRVEPSTEYLQLYNKNIHAHGKKPVTKEDYLKHCHLKINYKISMNESGHFYYHDIRRFGSWHFTNDPTILIKHLAKLGHDPLIEQSLTDIQVIELFRRFNHQNICKALMAQELIAGIGSYICVETLYESQINPLALIQDIPDKYLAVLYKSIRNIAHTAYNSGGASLYTYTGMNGDQTDFKNTLKIYGKRHDPLGHIVCRITDKESPDRRSKCYVKEIQTIGFPKTDLRLIKKLSTPIIKVKLIEKV